MYHIVIKVSAMVQYLLPHEFSIGVWRRGICRGYVAV